MGRGLSKLQESVLVLALEKRCERLRLIQFQSTGRYHPCNVARDIYVPDVMYSIYGIGSKDPLPAESHDWAAPGDPHGYGHFFSLLDSKKFCMVARWYGGKVDCKPERYRAAAAAISRCMTRLEARGLIERHKREAWTGFNLTEAGVDQAVRLAPEDRRVELAGLAVAADSVRGVTPTPDASAFDEWIAQGEAISQSRAS